MKEIRHPSVVPFYGAAALWLLYCVVIPLYRWYHLAIGLLLAAAAFFVLRRFFPGTVEQAAVPEPEPDTGDAELDAAILKGRADAARLAELAESAPELRADVVELSGLLRKILHSLEEQPSKLGQARQFLSYYPSTTLRLVDQYLRLRQTQVQGGAIAETMEKIRRILGQVGAAYRRELDSLYDRDVMDITADIQVLENMMAGDGLTNG